MKPHANGKQWGNKASDNNITYNKRIINAPQRILENEKLVLCQKMLYGKGFTHTRPFSDKRHSWIYNSIEPFYECYEATGISTENFIQYLKSVHDLDGVGGENFIRHIFQNLEVEGVLF